MAKFRPKKKTIAKRRTLADSMYQGPAVSGMTYSLMCRWLNCHHRFHLRVVEGLREAMDFNAPMEYGNFWHEAEEAFAKGRPWMNVMLKHKNKLLDEYGIGAEKEINKWHNIATMQFPLYLRKWRNDNERFRYSIQEKPFSLMYKTKNGIVVRLRGKFDAIFAMQKSIYIQENKTKGRIDEEAHHKTVDQNLQTMFYHIALRLLRDQKRLDAYHAPFAALHKQLRRGDAIEGTLYNVVRRPLADKFCIKQKKSETETQFLARLKKIIEKEDDYFFKRWQVSLSETEIRKFRHEVFDPILEDIHHWWESIKDDPFDPYKSPRHFRMPFGVYNPMASGFRGDFFELLTSGNRSGLVKVPTLFPELDTP